MTRRLDRALAAALWLQHLPAAEIAQRLGTTANNVYTMAYKGHWPKRQPGPRRATPKRVSPVVRNQDRAAASLQLARCEAILALETLEVPQYRRCPECDGLEATGRPHEHGRGP